MTVILINSSENIEDHKESPEGICDVSGESSNTLLMRKLRNKREMLKIIVIRPGRARTSLAAVFFLHTSMHIIRPQVSAVSRRT